MTKFEDRNYIKRYQYCDVNDTLIKKHGERYLFYRKDWDNTELRTGYHSEYPLDLFVEINTNCNLNCKMCINNTSSGNKVNFNMDLKLIKNIANQCAELDVPAIAIGLNAEPTLHPDYKEIVKTFRRNAIDIWAYTNGLRLNHDLIEFYIEQQVERLLISIDAASVDTYRQIRGANLEVLEKNIYELINSKHKHRSALPIIRLSFVKMLENIHEIGDFIKKWEHKVDIIDFQDLIDCTNLDNPQPADVEPFVCSHPFQRIGIDWDGSIYPCCGFYYKHFKIGNINEMTLAEAWKSDALRTLRESFFNGKIHPACQNCYGNLKHRSQSE